MNFSDNEKDDDDKEAEYLSVKRKKSTRFKGIQSKSDQSNVLKANTEQKSKNFGNEFMGEDPGKYSQIGKQHTVPDKMIKSEGTNERK